MVGMDDDIVLWYAIKEVDQMIKTIERTVTSKAVRDRVIEGLKEQRTELEEKYLEMAEARRLAIGLWSRS